MSTCGIYKFENKINHNIYIGQSVDIERRYKDHLNRAKNPHKSNTEYDSVLHQAIRKYGIENFLFEIVEVCPNNKEILNNKERFWIAFYDSFSHGYNATSGGEAQEPSLKIDKCLADQIKHDLLYTTDTYDVLHEKYNISTGRISEINTGKIWYDEKLDYPLRKKDKISPSKICPICGGIKDKDASLCLSCYRASLTKPVTREELKDLIRTTPFTTIAKKYNVTDNAIRKWCIGYKLPSKKKEISAISDKDWEKL